MTATGVLATLSEEHRKLCEELEKQELDVSVGISNGQLYAKLLALYLLQNDLCNAKCLWKRTPQTIKLATPELALVWSVGQKMWQRDFPGIYSTLSREWSEDIAQIMQALKEMTRTRALHLISHAYSYISFEDFAGYVGLPTEQALQLVRQRGWSIDQASRMVVPVKSAPTPVPGAPSEEQLIKLTDFVSFLEN